MARITAAFASSHSVMLAAQLDDWLTRFRVSDRRMPYYDAEGRKLTFDQVLAAAPADAETLVTPEAITRRFEETQAALARLREEVIGAKLDALVIVGDDQYELFHDQLMPAIGIYYGENIRNAKRTELPAEEWYKRAQMRRLEESGDVHYPCHRPLALHLIEQLTEREFDVAAIAGLRPEQYEGHAYSFVHRWMLKDHVVPIVPIFVNTYNPPNPPTPKRCIRFGAALAELIASFPGDLRVGVFGSGGLSHFRVEEDLDRAVLDAVAHNDLDALGNLDSKRLLAGSSEIRNWIIVASAARHLKMTWSAYVPAYRTPALTGTGLGFARWA